MNDITKKPNQVFIVEPTTNEDLYKWAKYVAGSELVPVAYRGKPANVVVAMQMGRNIGLSGLQAIQNIAVINGRPCLWGDALLAVAQNHKDFEYVNEYIEGEGDKLTAVCEVKRKDAPVRVVKFNVEDAKLAKLWGKGGPWSLYPKRMLQMRARGFAVRDVFADALQGMSSAEEVRDYKVIEGEKDITPMDDQLPAPEAIPNVELSETEKMADDVRSKL